MQSAKEFNTQSLACALEYQRRSQIGVVEQRMPQIRRRLAKFEFRATASLVAGLLVTPRLHANTLRIEVLQHLVCLYSRGKWDPAIHDLDECLNRYLGNSDVARMEDPPED